MYQLTSSYRFLYELTRTSVVLLTKKLQDYIKESNVDFRIAISVALFSRTLLTLRYLVLYKYYLCLASKALKFQ